jgi:hypothetical protein
MKNPVNGEQIKSPIESPIENHLTVRGILVTFHESGEYVIHAKSLEEAQMVQQYLITEGIFVLSDGSEN